MTSWPWLADLVRAHQSSPVPADVASIRHWLEVHGFDRLLIDAPDSITRGGDAYLQVCSPESGTGRLDAYLEDQNVDRLDSERRRVAAILSEVLGQPELATRDLTGLEWAEGERRIRVEQRNVDTSTPPRCACMAGVDLPSTVRVTIERVGGCAT